MAKILELPKLSPTMEEGQVSTWHKKEGDSVAVDDLLAEVETDKATMEYRSFDKGTLLKILVPPGDIVQLGQPVAILGAPGDDISALLDKVGNKSTHEKDDKKATQDKDKDEDKGDKKARQDKGDHQGKGGKDETEASKDTDSKKKAPESKTEDKAAAAEPAPSAGRVKASPYVRKLAREHNLDLGSVSGSGPGGRIIARDIDNLLHEAPAARPAAAARPSHETKPLSMMRKTIARRLTEAWQKVPHFYLTMDIDAEPLHLLREQLNADLASTAGEGQKPVKISFNDLIIKASAIALLQVPDCNAQFTPDAIILHDRVDISVAVAVPEGLMTPVVRDADKKTVLEIGAEVRELAARAKAKKLRPEEMSNGTFSISNLGMYGIDDFAAVINPPEGAILAVGQVRREPVVKGEQIVPGRRMAVTLSCDHRVIDGAIGATFLKALRQLIEHPTRILLE